MGLVLGAAYILGPCPSGSSSYVAHFQPGPSARVGLTLSFALLVSWGFNLFLCKVTSVLLLSYTYREINNIVYIKDTTPVDMC